MRLDEREDSTPEEQELTELLTVLIGKYEERRFSIRRSAQQTLHHLMEPESDAEVSMEGLRIKRNNLPGFSREALN